MQEVSYPKIITKDYLDRNPNIIFVFGDNLVRTGHGGAAILRHHPQAYGFITKKAPTYNLNDYYVPKEYLSVFHVECHKLLETAKANPNKTFLISEIGNGLANKFKIFEKVIAPMMKEKFIGVSNVVFLW